jgi:hypothetical protein
LLKPSTFGVDMRRGSGTIQTQVESAAFCTTEMRLSNNYPASVTETEHLWVDFEHQLMIFITHPDTFGWLLIRKVFCGATQANIDPTTFTVKSLSIDIEMFPAPNALNSGILIVIGEFGSHDRVIGFAN